MSSVNKSIEGEIHHAIDSVVELDLDNDILRTRVHGERVNFEDIKPDLKAALKLLKQAQLLDFSVMPEEFLKKLKNRTQSVKDKILSIRDFNIVGNDPDRDRHNKIVAFHQEYAELLPLIITALQFNILTSDEVSPVQLMQKMESHLQETTKKKEEFEAFVTKHTETVNQTVQKFGMRSYAKTFMDESNDFKKSSGTWLWCGIGDTA
jgi:hypothetical protein